MPNTTSDDLETLRSAMQGVVLGPGDDGYHEARRVWNADIDRRPAAIARCRSTDDVKAAVAFALEHDLELAVRGGAHSGAGASVVDDGLVVDLGALNKVTVDPVNRLARVEGGALLSDVDAATQVHGLAVPAGLISHTGIGGLTLGGGMGWLTRRAGLTIDNLESARMVTADGRLLHVTAHENPDLFWAIRGGGGNFGVVTEFEFRLHEVGPLVSVGLLFWELEHGPQVLRLARDTIETLPRDFNIVIAALNAPPAPFVPEQYHLRPGYALIVVGFGALEAHEELVARLRSALPPLFDFATPMPFADVQKLFDEANAWGFHTYDTGCYLDSLSDDAIAAVVEHVPQRNSPLSALLFYRLDGAYCEVADDDTAFGGTRTPRFAVFFASICPAPDLLPGERSWAREFCRDLGRQSALSGAYVNVMSEADTEQTHGTYGDNKYARLAAVKAKYDPGNVFHRNVNITPVSSPT
ncbi:MULTISPECIES: FAD-binding oxidoreductase [Rhodococcus]|uniref:FAD-binding oxidoreductase n=1 Tax=Rhodococcus TaxID=1827 RepID=UPI000B5A7855|nr:FAD-binding oxidoreductase [Rhodococcus sp. BUPNP1]MXQ76562.1 FAD-binding protein [Rhodococcus rhodochrous]OWY79847.1 FAD-linked oxidoreductase [Rhodococcus sp. BUPNP1]